LHGVELGVGCQLTHRFYPWPGNVRELENLKRGVVLSSGPTLDFDAHLLQAPPPPAKPASVAPSSIASVERATSATAPDSPSALEQVERRHILNVLERTAWAIEGLQGAAQLLNLTPSALRSRMKKARYSSGLGVARASARERIRSSRAA
jgi:formate hydrogenlyase transcriptional activator